MVDESDAQDDPKEVRNRIGTAIRERRRSLEMTQASLAATLGWSQETLSRYEKGVIPIRGEDFPRLAKALGVPTNYFFDADPSEAGGYGDKFLRRDEMEFDLLRRFRKLYRGQQMDVFDLIDYLERELLAATEAALTPGAEQGDEQDSGMPPE